MLKILSKMYHLCWNRTLIAPLCLLFTIMPSCSDPNNSISSLASMDASAVPEMYSGRFNYILSDCKGPKAEDLNYFTPNAEELDLSMSLLIDGDQLEIKRDNLFVLKSIWDTSSTPSVLTRTHGRLGIGQEENWTQAVGSLRKKVSLVAHRPNYIEGDLKNVTIEYLKTSCKLDFSFSGVMQEGTSFILQ